MIDTSVREPVRAPEQTCGEEAFDRIVRLTAKTLRASVALIVLRGQNGAYIKSAVGAPHQWRQGDPAPFEASFLDRILESRAPVLARDATSHILARGLAAFAGAPLMSAEGYALGLLCAIDRSPRDWSQEDAATLRDLAELAITDIHLARDLAERQQAEKRIMVQHDVSRVMAESTDLDEAGPKILEAIGENLGWELGALWTVDRRRSLLRARSTWQAAHVLGTEFEKSTREMAFARGTGLPGRVWADGKPVWIPDIDQEPFVSRLRFIGLEDLHGMFLFPLRSGRKVIGVIEFVAKELRSPDEDLLRTVSTLGNQIGEFMERAAGEEELRVRDRAIASSSNGIVITDAQQPDNPIVYVNPAFERLTGYSSDEVIGRNCRFLQGQDTDPEAVAHARQAIAENQECNVILLNYHKDGTTFWNDLTIAPVRDDSGRVTHFVGLQTDITDRKRYEQELYRAKEAAEVSSKAKSQFLANMSHELRTPLNAIIGYSEMLQEQAQDLDLKDLLPDLERIHGAGKHLLGLINDILDLSKIEAGRMELFLEHIDVPAMIRDVTTIILPLVEQNGNRLEVECPEELPPLRADLTKLRQSLLNLLSNAAKFTENGRIRLAVGRVESGGGQAMTFSISDTGMGITPEQLSRLFEPFSQANASTTRKFGGTGLGLAITRRFCRLMGGDIAVSSTPGDGSTFTITIPLNVPKAPREPIAPPKTAGTRQPVLVIDDDPAARDLLSRTLRKEGLEAVPADNGQEGLRLARTLHPVAITLDVMMPQMDGWAVLAALKADRELRDIPVIMVTIVDQKNLGYALGASDYLTKPVSREQLCAVLRKYRCPHPPCPVLLVEDDATTRDMLRAMLEQQGWKVNEAENGKVALRRVEENPPNVILLDLMMPEMDGFEFIELLRAREEWRSIPVVVITAMDLSEDDRRRLSGAVEKILWKGAYTREELLHNVRDLVSACVKQ